MNRLRLVAPGASVVVERRDGAEVFGVVRHAEARVPFRLLAPSPEGRVLTLYAGQRYISPADAALLADAIVQAVER